MKIINSNIISKCIYFIHIDREYKVPRRPEKRAVSNFFGQMCQIEAEL